MQALDRSQPVLPMVSGTPERRTHDYARHGVTSLFAAFNIATGEVISDLHTPETALANREMALGGSALKPRRRSWSPAAGPRPDRLGSSLGGRTGHA
jgi:hypothetical protein